MLAMLGWFSADARWPSRTSRERSLSVDPAMGDMRLTATVRRSLVSSARYTSPMPPEPRRTCMRKRPIMAPVKSCWRAAPLGGNAGSCMRALVFSELVRISISRHARARSGFNRPRGRLGPARGYLELLRLEEEREQFLHPRGGRPGDAKPGCASRESVSEREIG